MMGVPNSPPYAEGARSAPHSTFPKESNVRDEGARLLINPPSRASEVSGICYLMNFLINPSLFSFSFGPPRSEFQLLTLTVSLFTRIFLSHVSQTRPTGDVKPSSITPVLSTYDLTGSFTPPIPSKVDRPGPQRSKVPFLLFCAK